ncbi:hypothetical protein [Pelagibacterium montanilacus]|uniref:hypothetical protein n=1 Tax=Pelagibacterium montanilacus TaxID=2185280 RepID=UPI000F8CD704|nr:hypothetical protein [Pelagibacterium montanilacus]
MILTNHHLLLLAIARKGTNLEHAVTKAWWARRAIGAYVALSVTPVIEKEGVRKNLAIAHTLQPRDVPEWDELYKARFAKSIGAVEMALNQGLPLYSAAFDTDAWAFEDVCQWLVVLELENAASLTKLSRITWLQAIAHARKWQSIVHKTSHAVPTAGAQGTTAILGVGARSWVRLDTVDAVRREGAAMENCLIEGNHDDVIATTTLAASSGLFSLRNRRGRSIATVLLDAGMVQAAYGRANRPLDDVMKGELEALVSHLLGE